MAWALVLVVQGIGLFQVNLAGLAHQHWADADSPATASVNAAARIYDLAGRSYAPTQPKSSATGSATGSVPTRNEAAGHFHTGLSFHAHAFDLGKFTAQWFAPDAHDYANASDNDNSTGVTVVLALPNRCLPPAAPSATQRVLTAQSSAFASVAPKRRDRPPTLG
jgi:hypothetical protein